MPQAIQYQMQTLTCYHVAEKKRLHHKSPHKALCGFFLLLRICLQATIPVQFLLRRLLRCLVRASGLQKRKLDNLPPKIHLHYITSLGNGWREGRQTVGTALRQYFFSSLSLQGVGGRGWLYNGMHAAKQKSQPSFSRRTALPLCVIKVDRALHEQFAERDIAKLFLLLISLPVIYCFHC